MRRLRVLQTLDAVGGVWRYALDLARGLAPLGVETAFLGFGPPPSPAARAEALALGALDWSDQPLDWLAREPSALAGVPGAVAAAARARRADLVHLNVPSQGAGLPPGLPVLAFCHSCVTTWFRAVRGTDLPQDWAWQRGLAAQGLARADVVAAPTHAHAAAVAAEYPPFGPVRVVANATAAPERGEVERQDAGGPVILASGRWWDEAKGGATLDAAAGRVAWEVRLLGAARGPDGQEFRPRHATLEGPLDHEAALGRLRGAGIFAAPALYEPFGLAVAEAARAGLPLVLSDIPTFRELWGDAALLVPPREPEAWAQALDALAADPTERAHLGEAARARAARFTLDAQARAMRALYDEAATRAAAAA